MTPFHQLSPSDKAGPARKWTIVNDEWVQIYCTIIREGSGYREVPAEKAIAKESK